METAEKTAYFHALIPSQDTRRKLVGTKGDVAYGFDDAVHTRSNSPSFHVHKDGRLHLGRPGAYMANVSVRVSESSGPGRVCAGLAVETGPGHAPRKVLLVEVIDAPVEGQCRLHGSSLLHVGDPDYGVDSFEALVSLMLRLDGIAALADIHVTIQKIG